MFSFIYKANKNMLGFIVFAIIPVLMIINYLAGVFVGGFLLIFTCISALVFSRKISTVYVIMNIFAFLVFSYTNHMPAKVIFVQGSIFVFSLLLAKITGQEIKQFISRLELKRKQNCKLTKELIYSFVVAIDAKDQYLHNHSYNVSYYARKISEALNIDKRQIEIVALAALFHDIGKLNIPEEILNKPDKLNSEEWEIIKKHSSYGVDILSNVEEIKFILDIIKYHHRHSDGNGYPNDCPIESVPFESKIIAVADAFDAMTSDRPYRNAFDLETAYYELKKYSGTQFDEKVVEAFFKLNMKPVKVEVAEINIDVVLNIE